MDAVNVAGVDNWTHGGSAGESANCHRACIHRWLWMFAVAAHRVYAVWQQILATLQKAVWIGLAVNCSLFTGSCRLCQRGSLLAPGSWQTAAAAVTAVESDCLVGSTIQAEMSRK